MERWHRDSTRCLHEGHMALVALHKGRARAAGDSRFILSPFLAFVVALILALVPMAISAEPSRPGEYEVKAAFLYNFIKFTAWPGEEMSKSGEPFVIGVLGKDPFGAALDKVVEGETVYKKPIVTKRFSRLEDAASSHVLFISSSEGNNLPAILRALDNHSVLTVSEIENFAQRGGVINLKKENERIVFEINIDAAKQAGLTMNAQLLKLAKIVKGRP
jgi:hypothetical protein